MKLRGGDWNEDRFIPPSVMMLGEEKGVSCSYVPVFLFISLDCDAHRTTHNNVIHPWKSALKLASYETACEEKFSSLCGGKTEANTLE